MFGEVEQVLTVAAAVLVLVACRAAFLYFRPWRPCRWCRAGGLLRGSWPGRVIAGGDDARRHRNRSCWRCRGHRQTRRWGAWHVHKAKLSLVQAWDERGQAS